MLEIRKNNLPYYMPYSIINTNGDIIGDYRDIETARMALKRISDINQIKDKKNKDIIELAQKRMKNPNGDQPPKDIKRKVIL